MFLIHFTGRVTMMVTGLLYKTKAHYLSLQGRGVTNFTYLGWRGLRGEAGVGRQSSSPCGWPRAGPSTNLI